jgi:iron complex transport system substrate-binding protein
MKKVITLFLLLVSLVLPIFGSPVSEISSEKGIVDMRAREVLINKPIERIVATEAGSLRLLSYFNAIDKVVAVENSGNGKEKGDDPFFYLATYRIAHPQLKELPDIGSSSNFEAIIATGADLVISSTVDVAKLNSYQNSLNIPVFAIDADVELNNLELMIKQFLVMGELLNEKQRANQLIEGVKEIIEDLNRRTESVSKIKESYVGGMMYYGPSDLLRTTGDYDSFDLVNVNNVMSSNPIGNKQPYLTELEHLIKTNPKVVFIDTANENLSKKGYLDHKEIYDNHVVAFKTKDVYKTAVYKYYGTNWETPLINAYYVGKILYPEAFKDIDMKEVTQKILKLFYQKEISYEKFVELQNYPFKAVQWF